MSDDDVLDNVRHLPRIGSPPPPSVPPTPALDGDESGPTDELGNVRISAFDAPDVPQAPRPEGGVPAVLRSDGLDGQQPTSDAGPPRTGALSLAAILAIALAAFEGLQTWIQESGPRRAEAAAHRRELKLLAAKANADAVRHTAGADAARAKTRRGGGIPSSHDYGRKALGRGPGGPRRGGGGIGPGGARLGGSGLFSRSPHEPSRRSAAGRNGAASGTLSGGSRNGGPRSRTDTGSSRNGGPAGRNGGGRGRNGGSGNAGGGRGGGTARGATAGASGRRSPRRAVADWWNKGKKSPGTGAGPANTKAAVRGAVKAARSGPTFWKTTGDRLKDRWKARQSGVGAPGAAHGKAAGSGSAPGGAGAARPVNDGWTAPGDRVGFWDAVYESVNDRWNKRRERWKANGGPRKHTTARGKRSTGRGSSGSAGTAGAGDPGPGFGPRTSPFDTDQPGPDRARVRMERTDGGPGSQAKRWEPTAVGPAPRPLPRQGQPVLPRAPQRPAGQRPGTTRRKDPIPMPPAPARTGAVPGSVTASVPAPGGMSARHATEITLDGALKALTLLTTAGMETHDDCAELARQARRLLSELEAMALDLAENHNVTGPRTTQGVAALMEQVAQLVHSADRTARAALDAAELAEAEETAMARDYRPTQTATVDAGLAAPSARIHNEN